MKTKETSCIKCGSEAKPSKALLNTLIAAQDFGGETIHTRGATVSRSGKATLADCLKCTNCGHSWIPDEPKFKEGDLVYVIELEQPFVNWNGEIACYIGNGFYHVVNSSEDIITVKESNITLIENYKHFQDIGTSRSGKYKDETLGMQQLPKPNQKQFKEFNGELFVQYLSKFALKDRYNAVAAALLTLHLTIDELGEVVAILKKAQERN